jgi:hypothetical protein
MSDKASIDEKGAEDKTALSTNRASWRQQYSSKFREWWWLRLLQGANPASDNESDDDPTGPITVSPDPTKWRARRSIWPEGGWRRARWDEVFVPADPPENFAIESLAALVDKLKTSDEDVAKAILAEAEAAYSGPQQVIDSAERRATTLQGQSPSLPLLHWLAAVCCSIRLAFMAVDGASALLCSSPYSSFACSAVLYVRWARQFVFSTSRSPAMSASPTGLR